MPEKAYIAPFVGVLCLAVIFGSYVLGRPTKQVATVRSCVTTARVQLPTGSFVETRTSNVTTDTREE